MYPNNGRLGGGFKLYVCEKPTSRERILDARQVR